MAEKKLRIGCCSGFWGDSHLGARQLVEKGRIDYLVGDYLAEVTMGLLARMKSQGGGSARGGMGEGGFVAEFVYSIWKPLMPSILDQNMKIIVNAGGMNPQACKAAIEQVAEKAGRKVRVACVCGDDLMEEKETLLQDGALHPFAVEETEEPLLPDGKICISFNAYVGAMPIVQALRAGAQVIVTGRCVDSALVLAPLIYEFGWKETDYDLLATGSLGGHILECGCQATGGNFTDWKLSAASPNGGWVQSGYPIIEFSSGGDMVVTKPPQTGGLISFGTVAEQIVYEIHDPSSYHLPDVILDFREVTLQEIVHSDGQTAVRVQGAKGRAPTSLYKVSATYFDGYWMSAELLMTGFEVVEKSHAVAEAILGRCRLLLEAKKLGDFIATNVEVLGAEHNFGTRATSPTREAVLRISVHHKTADALKIFGREVAPSALAMAPGLTGAGSGRPRPAPFVRHYGALVNKDRVPIRVQVGTDFDETAVYTSGSNAVSKPVRISSPYPSSMPPGTVSVRVPLIALCYGRSGDKGDVANVGIIARREAYYPFLLDVLTASRVREFFAHFVKGQVTRYEMPGIRAMNFVMTRSLGGGGLSSLQIDRQGKSYAQNLLTMMVDVPRSWGITWPISRM